MIYLLCDLDSEIEQPGRFNDLAAMLKVSAADAKKLEDLVLIS